MVDIKRIDKQNDATSVGRAAYATPRLKVFGPVGALTQGGSAGDSEVSGTMMNMSSMRRA